MNAATSAPSGLPHSFDTPAAGKGGSLRSGADQAKREEVEANPDDEEDDPEDEDANNQDDVFPVDEWKPYDRYDRSGDPNDYLQTDLLGPRKAKRSKAGKKQVPQQQGQPPQQPAPMATSNSYEDEEDECDPDDEECLQEYEENGAAWVTHPKQRTKNRKPTSNTTTAAAKLTFAINAVEQANGTPFIRHSYEAFKVSQIARNQQQHQDASTVHKIAAGLHTNPGGSFEAQGEHLRQAYRHIKIARRLARNSTNAPMRNTGNITADNIYPAAMRAGVPNQLQAQYERRAASYLGAGHLLPGHSGVPVMNAADREDMLVTPVFNAVDCASERMMKHLRKPSSGAICNQAPAPPPEAYAPDYDMVGVMATLNMQMLPDLGGDYLPIPSNCY
jgi:hypothetical protein